jgi:hypothetical protein
MPGNHPEERIHDTVHVKSVGLNLKSKQDHHSVIMYSRAIITYSE